MGGPELHATLPATLHAAFTCVTNNAGQPICTGTSAGTFAGLGIFLFIYLIFAVIGIVAAVKVVTKAGYSGWWVLIAFVPIVGTVFVLIFAFSEWPVLREVRMLRAQVAGARGYGRPGGYGGWSPSPPPGAPPGPLPAGAPTGTPPGPPGPAGPADPATTAETVALPTFGQFIQDATAPQAPSVVPGPAPSTPTGPPAQQLPAPGWFPSPGGPPGQWRFWDGATWTDQYR